MRWSLLVTIAVTMLVLSGCSFLSAGERATMSRISAEIGGKAVLEWDIRKRSVEWLTEACKRKTGPIEARIDCVKRVLELL